MKRILISLAICLWTIVAFAENSESQLLPSDRNHWTITMVSDFSIPGKWKLAGGSCKMFKPGIGVSFGADYMWLISNNFFFEPGARFFIDSYNYDSIIIGDGTLDEPSRVYDPPVRKIGFRIPLTVGYKFDIFKTGSLFLSTGPEPIIGISARTEVDVDQKDIFEENMYKGLMRRFDVAWDIRAAATINNLRVDLTGAFGLLDIIKAEAKMHEYRFSVGIGYMF